MVDNVPEETKVLNLYLSNPEYLCSVAKALSSPTRLDILNLVNEQAGLNIKEIAERLSIPASTAAIHIKALNEANLLILEEEPGTRGASKRCHHQKSVIHIFMDSPSSAITRTSSFSIPVGSFTECRVSGTSGMADVDGCIGQEDTETTFYLPEKYRAGIVWLANGYLEYKIPNNVPKFSNPKSLLFSMELCSESCGFNEEWKSDITFWVNGADCGTWRSPGDMGSRRGAAYPPNSQWPRGSTQYGFMVTLEINGDGSFIGRKKVSDVTIDDLSLMSRHYITLRIGNKPDAKYIGGINIFGRDFGDYGQDIQVTVEY
ncbi:MAG: helix-turn-helix domain-containing protein [Oscillospiraceae bacterium]